MVWQDICQPRENYARPPWYKGGKEPPAILQDCSLLDQNLRGTPEEYPRHLATLHAIPQAAHQGSGRGVPDLHEVVPRPADDKLPVRGESNATHFARVTRQLAHLPPTPLHLRG